MTMSDGSGQPEGEYRLESTTSTRSVSELQSRLRTLAQMDYVQPSDPEVIALKAERRSLLREADGIGLFDTLRKTIAGKQQKIGQAGYTYDEVTNEIAGIDTDTMERRFKLETIRIKGSDAWNSNLEGAVTAYKEVALLVMQDAQTQAQARFSSDRDTKKTAQDQTEDLHRQVEIMSWGTIPEDIYSIARVVEVQTGHEHEAAIHATPKTRSTEEQEIYGKGDAFSLRWTRSHGIPDIIQASPQAGIAKPFSPAEKLSQTLRTGITTQPQWYQVSASIEASSDPDFAIGANNGLIRLINVNQSMEAGRLDTLAASLKEGPTPQGIAQWLLADQETRRCLAIMFRLQGYNVAENEQDNNGTIIHDATPSMIENVRFSDANSINHDQIEAYLATIQQVIGTDSGVVRLAYTIFRMMGFPHENGHLLSLINNYSIDYKSKNGTPFTYKDKNPLTGENEPTGKRENSSGDLSYIDLEPFIESEGNGKLVRSLETHGITGLATTLNSSKAESIARYWGDLQLIWDMMNNVADIRKGQGAAANLGPEKRLQTLQAMKELQIALAKRKFEDKTVERLLSPKRISTAQAAGEPSFWEKTLHGMKTPLSGLKGKPNIEGKKKR